MIDEKLRFYEEQDLYRYVMQSCLYKPVGVHVEKSDSSKNLFILEAESYLSNCCSLSNDTWVLD